MCVCVCDEFVANEAAAGEAEEVRRCVHTLIHTHRFVHELEIASTQEVECARIAHTYIHTYIYTYIHTYAIDTYIHTYIHTLIHTHRCIRQLEIASTKEVEGVKIAQLDLAVYKGHTGGGNQ